MNGEPCCSNFGTIFRRQVPQLVDMGDGKTAVYDVDLDNMGLIEDYGVY